MRGLALLIVLAGLAGAARAQDTAQDKTMTLAADARLSASGLLDYLVPRFALKTGVRVAVLPGTAEAIAAEGAEGADAALVPEEIAEALAAGWDAPPRRVILAPDPGQGGAFAVVLAPGSPRADHARRFADWLASEIGQRTVASFEGPVAYGPGVQARAEEAAVLPEGDIAAGEDLSIRHCGRCHVVSDKNRFAGIGSTPSFPALRSIPGWEEKFLTFWDANPHPSFLQVTGVTEPFDPDRPPHIAPVEITVAEMEAIVAYAASIPPMDLGAEVQSR